MLELVAPNKERGNLVDSHNGSNAGIIGFNSRQISLQACHVGDFRQIVGFSQILSVKPACRGKFRVGAGYSQNFAVKGGRFPVVSRNVGPGLRRIVGNQLG